MILVLRSLPNEVLNTILESITNWVLLLGYRLGLDHYSIHITLYWSTYFVDHVVLKYPPLTSTTKLVLMIWVHEVLKYLNIRIIWKSSTNSGDDLVLAAYCTLVSSFVVLPWDLYWVLKLCDRIKIILSTHMPTVISTNEDSILARDLNFQFKVLIFVCSIHKMSTWFLN